MSKKRRGNSRYYLLFFSIAIAIFLFGKGITLILNKVDIFKINRIEITDNINLEKEFLEKLVADFYGQNLYAVSRSDVMQRYANIIRIADTKVTRVFPDKLKIRISEKMGKFLLKTRKGDLIPVDDQLTVLDNDNFYKHDVLPIIHTEFSADSLQVGSTVSNQQLETIINFYKEIEKSKFEFSLNISEMYIQDEDIFIVAENSGHKVLFGEGDIESKLERYTFLEANNSFDSESIVDLRFKNRLVVRLEIR